MCTVKSIIDKPDIDLHIHSDLGKGNQFSYIFYSSMLVKMINQKDESHLQNLK